MRINIIPVSLLTDQHLIAELREIKMLPKSLARSLKSKVGVDFNDLPKSYILNKGHGKFFYDKLNYIEDRFYKLLDESKSRGFNFKSDELYDNEFDYTCITLKSYKLNYVPTLDEMVVNVERILERIYEMIFIKQKCNFYKHNGTSKLFLEWCIFYQEELNISYESMFDIILNIELKNKEL